MTRGEFDLIATYFKPLAADLPGAMGLQNDAAILEAPAGRSLVATIDTLVDGVHYLPDDPPDQVARKLLRVNLSDLAAMGARPLAYLLSVAFSGELDEAWIASFAKGLREDQETFSLSLLGGDTVRTPGPTTLTLAAFGSVAPGSSLSRTTAQAGDDVYLSGTLGDAALGLLVRRGRLDLAPALSEALVTRYRLPEPRLALGEALTGLASAGLDVSDGLVADLGHVAEGSRLGADVFVSQLPLSSAARAALLQDRSLISTALAGGDDYELLFTIAPQRSARLAELAGQLDLTVTRIGRMRAGEGVRVLDERGRPLELESCGWRHF